MSYRIARHLPGQLRQTRCSINSQKHTCWRQTRRHCIAIRNDSQNGNGKPAPVDLDAIIVLAGGIREDASLPPWVHRRLDTAASLFKQQQNSNCRLLLSGGGTPHKPTVLSHGYIVFESTSCAEYLMERQGLSSEVLLKETSSFDTVGNGYFSLTQHAIPCRWRRIGVVTSEFHMPRSRAIIETCCNIAAQDLWGDTNWYDLSFVAASDEGLFESDVYEARIEKEAAAIKRWHLDTHDFKTLAELHAWLFATHMCYSVNRQHEFGRPTGLNPKLAATY